METWVVFALLAAVFAAAVAVLGKIGVASLDPTVATAVRSAVMTVFLLGATVALGKIPAFREVGSRPLVFVALSGVAGALSWLCYFWALKLGPASGVAAIDRSSVVLVLLLAALFLSEPLNWRSGMGAVLMTLGAVLVAWR